MATGATSGYGVKLKRGAGDGPPETFTDVAEVINIEGPGLKLNLADATNQDSTGRWNEFVPTLLEGGEINVDLNFKPGNATQGYSSGVIGDMVNRTLRNFKVVFSDSGATGWVLPCYVTGFTPGALINDKLSAKVVLTVSGEPTLA